MVSLALLRRLAACGLLGALGLGAFVLQPLATAQVVVPRTPAEAASAAAGPKAASPWTPLEKDGIHDPRNPGLRLLQQPGDALVDLPRDTAGNQVRWVQALDSGAIAPRAALSPGTPVRVYDGESIISKFGSMPAVRFPHRQHTLWLDCDNCHNHLFKDQAGANRFSMQAILEGEQCGLCHGAVSFPLTECNRCHSVPNASLRRRPPAEPAASAP